ncbi:17963_t:CDS:1, partial [Gigaspora margarita]
KNLAQILAIAEKQIAIRNHALVEKTVRYTQDVVDEFYVDNAKILSSISKF